jgi:hypothetical protein
VRVGEVDTADADRVFGHAPPHTLVMIALRNSKLLEPVIQTSAILHTFQLNVSLQSNPRNI